MELDESAFEDRAMEHSRSFFICARSCRQQVGRDESSTLGECPSLICHPVWCSSPFTAIVPLICYVEATEEEKEDQGSSNYSSWSKLHKTDSIIRHIDKQTVTDWESKCAEQEIEIDQSKCSAFWGSGEILCWDMKGPVWCDYSEASLTSHLRRLALLFHHQQIKYSLAQHGSKTV